MSYTPPVLAYDPTGQLADNYILGEIHSPPLAKNRLLIPIYGNFFTHDFSVVDAVTDAPVDTSLYSFTDMDGVATEQGAGAVYSCIILDQAAPSSVRISYHALGGPNSRNAAFLLNWLSERGAMAGRTIDWSEVKNKPKRFEPKEHLHLLSHVYGMEYVQEALDRLNHAISVGRESMWLEYNFQIQRRLEQLAERTENLAISLAHAALDTAKEEFTLFAIGLDLIENLSVLGDQGNLIAPGNFDLQTMDERYVDLRGLGSFCKGLAKRMLGGPSIGGLGLEYGEEWVAQKGSFLGSAQGAVFILPSKKSVAGTSLSNIRIYPEGFPDTDKFIVKRLSSNSFDVGGVFQGWNASTGDTYFGLLLNEKCKSPLVWNKAYKSNDTIDLEKLVEDHAKANNNPHMLSKEQVALHYVENLPVVTKDEISTATPVKKLVTMDALLYHMLARMEGTKLEWGENGEVDYTDDPMSKPKIVFVPCTDKISGNQTGNGDDLGGSGNGSGSGSGDFTAIDPITGEPKIKPRGQFISSFCDGSDKYTRWTDGKGSFYDELTDKESDDCEFRDMPRQGELLSSFCQNQNKYNRYADGRGGSITETVRINDPECGYRSIDEEGHVLAEYCRGKDLYVRYADGVGGFYELPSFIDTYRCGGSIFPPGGGTGSGGDGGGATGNKPKITYASTHSKIYVGTVEIQSFYAQNLIPGQSYNVDWWERSPVVDSNKSQHIRTVSIRASEQGSYIFERQDIDAGVTPRGVYDCWLEVTLLDISSNHIERQFMSGEPEEGGTDPNSPTGSTRPDGGGAGSGGTDSPSPPAPGASPPPPGQEPPKLDVGGNPYNPNNLWPPPPLYSPKITLSSTHYQIKPKDSEVITMRFTGFMASKDYFAEFINSSPAAFNGTPTTTWSTWIKTSNTGEATYSLPRYDDGSTPRGSYDCWVTAGETASSSSSWKSNNITRVFANADPNTGYTYDPKLVLTSSNTTITKGMGYTQTAVLTGGERNQMYSVGVRGAFMAGMIGFRDFWNTVAQTDDKGYFRIEKAISDDGTTPRNSYILSCGASIAGVGWNITSNTVHISYVDGATNSGGSSGTGYASISYDSDQTTVSWTVPENQSISVIRGTKGDKIRLQFWMQAPFFNNNVPYMTLEVTAIVDDNGNAVYKHKPTIDDGTVPRGTFACWAACPEYSLISSSIYRSFVVNNTGTPAPTPSPPPGQTPSPTPPPPPPADPLQHAQVQYSTNMPTVLPGVTETHTVTLVNFVPNTTYQTEWWISGPALNNGNAPFLTWGKSTNPAAPKVTTNSGGGGTFTHTTRDDQITPRGTYSCWVEVSGKKSPPFTRTFANPPVAPVPVYKPTLTFRSTQTTIQPGTSETLSWSMSGAQPNKVINIEHLNSHPAINGGITIRSITQNAVVNSSGNAGLSISNAADDGISMPRGTVSSWVYCPEYNLTSNTIKRNFVAAPTPTPPPYNPHVTYTSTHSGSVVTKGTYETFRIQISGFRPDTTYTVARWTSGTVTVHDTTTMRTNSAGSASLSWSTVDDGTTVPRGVWDSWCVIQETGTSSSVFTRRFA